MHYMILNYIVPIKSLGFVIFMNKKKYLMLTKAAIIIVKILNHCFQL